MTSLLTDEPEDANDRHIAENEEVADTDKLDDEHLCWSSVQLCCAPAGHSCYSLVAAELTTATTRAVGGGGRSLG